MLTRLSLLEQRSGHAKLYFQDGSSLPSTGSGIRVMCTDRLRELIKEVAPAGEPLLRGIFIIGLTRANKAHPNSCGMLLVGCVPEGSGGEEAPPSPPSSPPPASPAPELDTEFQIDLNSGCVECAGDPNENVDGDATAEATANAEAIAEELESLQAIYGGIEGIEVLDDAEGGTSIGLEVVGEREWCFRLGSPSNQQAYVLEVSLPCTYPSRDPPRMKLHASALDTDAKASLKERLFDLYDAGEVVVFSWVNLLQEEMKAAAEAQAAQEEVAEALRAEAEAVKAKKEAATQHGNAASDDGLGLGPIPMEIKAFVVNLHDNKCKVYIGRPDAAPKGKSTSGGHPKWGWGNPFSMGGGASRGSVIRQYTDWLMAPERAEMRAEARRDLHGKTLGCFCTPLQCHGFVLAMVANSKSDEELCGDPAKYM